MLSLRQLTSVVWTFLGFMVVASLVLNLRYKTLDDGAAFYVDTWTGKTHSAAVAEAPEKPAANGKLDIVILERLERLTERQVHRHRIETECATVRFAFPAPVTEHRR